MNSNDLKRKLKAKWNWKTKKVKWDKQFNSFDDLWDYYESITHCQKCKCELTNGRHGDNKKILDHEHNTGYVRAILCNLCNTSMLDRCSPCNTRSKYKNINYDSTNKLWVYKKIHRRVMYKRKFKDLQDALIYKFYMILKLNYEEPPIENKYPNLNSGELLGL